MPLSHPGDSSGMDPGCRESFQNSLGDSNVHPRLRTATCGTWGRSGSEQNGAPGPRQSNALRGKIGGVTRMGEEMGKRRTKKALWPRGQVKKESVRRCAWAADTRSEG